MSSTSDVATPPEVYNDLNEVCRFTHDPCPLNGETDPLCPDGLDRAYPWGDVNFVNPPFNRINLWLARAAEEWYVNNKRSIVLVPFRSHTVYWRLHVMDKCTSLYIFFKGMKFPGYSLRYPMPMCLVAYGEFAQFPAEIGGLPIRRFYAASD